MPCTKYHTSICVDETIWKNFKSLVRENNVGTNRGMEALMKLFVDGKLKYRDEDGKLRKLKLNPIFVSAVESGLI